MGTLGQDFSPVKVLVVHPFARSIQMQYARRSKVKSICDCCLILSFLPSFRGYICRTRQRQDMGANLQSLMSEVAKQQFDVALIGCGAYGFSTWAFVKQMGRQAIHLAEQTNIIRHSR